MKLYGIYLVDDGCETLCKFSDGEFEDDAVFKKKNHADKICKELNKKGEAVYTVKII